MKYSSKLMFSAITALCVLLAMLGQHVSKSVVVVDSAKQLRSSGGTVVFDWEGSIVDLEELSWFSHPCVVDGETLRSRLKVGNWTLLGGSNSVESLEFNHQAFSPEVVDALSRIDSVDRLRFENCHITTKACEALGNIKGVQFLEVLDSQIDELELLVASSKRSLRKVYWESSSLSGEQLSVILRLRNLRFLSISGSRVADFNAIEFGEATNLIGIDLSRTEFNDSGLQGLLSASQLKRAIMTDTNLSNSGLASFVNNSSVEQIILADGHRASLILEEVERGNIDIH